MILTRLRIKMQKYFEIDFKGKAKQVFESFIHIIILMIIVVGL